MIMLCERCCGPIEDGEPVLRLAHIDRAHPDGSITWIHTFVHTAACPTEACPLPRAAPHQRPDVGTWDPARGIGSCRT